MTEEQRKALFWARVRAASAETGFQLSIDNPAEKLGSAWLIKLVVDAVPIANWQPPQPETKDFPKEDAKDENPTDPDSASTRADV